MNGKEKTEAECIVPMAFFPLLVFTENNPLVQYILIIVFLSPTTPRNSPLPQPPKPQFLSQSLSRTGAWPLPWWTGRCHTGVVDPGGLPPCTALDGTGTVARNSQSTCGHRRALEGMWGANKSPLLRLYPVFCRSCWTKGYLLGRRHTWSTAQEGPCGLNPWVRRRTEQGWV